MSPEVRRAALLAAAKATFIVSVGCSGGLQPPSSAGPAATSAATSVSGPAPAPTPTASAPAEPAATCAQHLDGLVIVNADQLAVNDPLRERGDVYGAFADVAARGSERTLQCCEEELRRDTSGAPHRWACCSALPRDTDLMVACTPWGPPCPPELLA